MSLSIVAPAVSSDSNSSGVRISSRRGSVSAPDPFAHNANVPVPKGQTSRLTIIRVPPSSEGSTPRTCGAQADVELSPLQANIPERVGIAYRPSEDAERRNQRMSFARSSFSLEDKPFWSDGLTTDSASTRNRASSISSDASSPSSHSTPPVPSPSTRRLSAFQNRRASLSPQQVCELAQTSFKVARIDGASPLISPIRDTMPLGSDTRDSHSGTSASPVSFAPLPDSQYLPFVDRPSEVTALLASEANKRFMALLKQTFPSRLYEGLGNIDVLDPTDWSFPSLVSYITECPRSKAADKVWVANIRRCIRSRCEVAWERFKDVLGVPPELDIDLSIETNGKEIGKNIRESEDEDNLRAWAEPISPTSYSPILISGTSTASVEFPECEVEYSGREHGMETIGEGDEEDNVVNVIDPPMDSKKTIAESSADPMNALRLHLHTSILRPDDRNKSSESSNSVFSVGVDSGTHLAIPVPERHVDQCAPLVPGDPDFPLSRVTARPRRLTTSVSELEHGTGNPLFPSNFRQISVGPTSSSNWKPLAPSAFSSRRNTSAVQGVSSENSLPRDSRGDYHTEMGSDNDKDSAAGAGDGLFSESK